MLGLPSCSTAPSSRYAVCEDAEGVAALQRARDSISDKDHERAIEEVRAALARCPDNVRAHLLYVEAVEGLKGDRGVAARAELHRYYQEAEHGDSPVWPYLRARMAEYDADREVLLRQAVELDPAFHWGYLSLARLWRSHGRLSRALAELDQALFARASFPEARLERAQVLVEIGRYRDAADDYAEYLRHNRGQRSVLTEYARLLIYQLGRTGVAGAIIQQQLDQTPGDLGALMDLAALAWKDGDVSQAVERYRAVLQRDPNRRLAVLNLANLHYDVLWRVTPGPTKAESWALAQKAYLYYLSLPAGDEDRYDMFDHHLAVPYRLREIGELVGEYDGRIVRVTDF